jgi:hypothetical protein
MKSVIVAAFMRPAVSHAPASRRDSDGHAGHGH